MCVSCFTLLTKMQRRDTSACACSHTTDDYAAGEAAQTPAPVGAQGPWVVPPLAGAGARLLPAATRGRNGAFGGVHPRKGRGSQASTPSGNVINPTYN